MKIITGGAGFIGSAICWKLNQLGFTDILIVDEDTKGTKQNNLSGLKYTDYIDKLDLLKQIEKGAINYGVDAVYHMGDLQLNY